MNNKLRQMLSDYRDLEQLQEFYCSSTPVYFDIGSTMDTLSDKIKQEANEVYLEQSKVKQEINKLNNNGQGGFI